MTPEEVIEMARQAGLVPVLENVRLGDKGVLATDCIKTFAKLVDAKATARERVACFDAAYDAHATTAVLEAIRARSISRGEA